MSVFSNTQTEIKQYVYSVQVVPTKICTLKYQLQYYKESQIDDLNSEWARYVNGKNNMKKGLFKQKQLQQQNKADIMYQYPVKKIPQCHLRLIIALLTFN